MYLEKTQEKELNVYLRAYLQMHFLLLILYLSPPETIDYTAVKKKVVILQNSPLSHSICIFLALPFEEVFFKTETDSLKNILWQQIHKSLILSSEPVSLGLLQIRLLWKGRSKCLIYLNSIIIHFLAIFICLV